MFDISKENFLKDSIKFPKKNIFIILLFLGFGEWFLSDLMNFTGGSIGFFILCFGGYFYLKNEKPKFREPKDLDGWIKLCTEDLDFFEEIEFHNNLEKQNIKRKQSLDQILNRENKEVICCIGQENFDSNKALFTNYFKKHKFDLNFIEKLPKYNSTEIVPDTILKSDAILYFLDLPLSAKDFLWLEKLPKSMPIWLVASSTNGLDYKSEIEELKAQISGEYANRIIIFDTNKNNLANIPFSFRKFFISSSNNIQNTKKRLLKRLHTNWQSEIEGIRRMQLKDLQRRNQVIVATSVFLSPIPSIDVLSMTVLNSLMIKEIKSIWGCNWSPEILDKVSKQIIKTAIAQGVIEWSGQMLIGLTKLHGPNWIVTGAYQAISAAYLSRVVSSSLADFMAITKGVSEPDLEFIKENSDKIVEKAFENEKINWKSLIPELKNPLIRLT